MYTSSYELTGIYYKDLGEIPISEKVTKREFILHMPEISSGGTVYKGQYIRMQLMKEKSVILDRFKIGDHIRVSFNLYGTKSTKVPDRESNEYRNHLNVYRIEKVNNQ